MKRLLALTCLGLVAACSSPGHPAAAKSTWGGFPSYLPSSTTSGDALHRTTDASATEPVLASQGDTVRVALARGSALVTVVGPGVPNEGLAYQAPTSPVSWTVTLEGLSGRVPVAASAFTSIDEDGRVYRLHRTSSAPVPPELTAGQSVTFTLATRMLTGEGRLRWIPVGHLSPVEWDFTVETD